MRLTTALLVVMNSLLLVLKVTAIEIRREESVGVPTMDLAELAERETKMAPGTLVRLKFNYRSDPVLIYRDNSVGGDIAFSVPGKAEPVTRRISVPEEGAQWYKKLPREAGATFLVYVRLPTGTDTPLKAQGREIKVDDWSARVVWYP